MKKILIFHKGLAPYRIDFFNAINSKFDVNFYFDNKFGDNTYCLKEDFLVKKCDFKPNYLGKGFNLFGRSFRLGIHKIIKSEFPTIVICNEYCPVTISIFFYYMFTKKFKMYTICDDSLLNAKSRKGLRKYIRNLISKNISGTILASEMVTNWFSENISKSEEKLILPIIHEDGIFRKKLEESLIQANKNIVEYDLKDKKVILYVGRLIALKNVTSLIKAFSRLDDDNLVLTIIGDGNETNNLKYLVKKLGIKNRVLFTGKLFGNQLMAWYNLSQVLVLPSTFEQFGAVINEALLAGNKVICSEVAGATSLITKDNGLLFRPLDISDLEQKLLQVLREQNALSNRIFEIRPNKMPFSFDEKIDALLSKL